MDYNKLIKEEIERHHSTMETLSLGQRNVAWNPNPDNDETWWKRSHCGPGTLNGEELCECGETMHMCAQANTEWMYETGEEKCGCSGFWCYKCGLFYPQDACWETYGGDFETLSGKKVILDKGWIHCHCGQKLFEYKEQN